MTAAIGCTGGEHRSVVLVGQLAQALESGSVEGAVRHPDAIDELISSKFGESE